jgi:hypothetical protein
MRASFGGCPVFGDGLRTDAKSFADLLGFPAIGKHAEDLLLSIGEHPVFAKLAFSLLTMFQIKANACRLTGKLLPEPPYSGLGRQTFAPS